MKSNTGAIVLLMIVVACGSFFGGMKYQASRITRSQFFANGQMGGNGQRRMDQTERFGQGVGLRPAAGEIINVTGDTVTVKLKDGGSRIVILSTDTVINKAAQGTRTDLKSGVTIAAFGKENSDGSITAQSIQLNPTMRRQ